MINLYQVIEYLSQNNLNIFNIDKSINQFINIEELKKPDIIKLRNAVSNNASIIYERFNDKLLSITDKKLPASFTTKEVAEILKVTTGAVKHWKDSGILEVIQEDERCNIKISKDALDKFVYQYPKYEKLWKEYKKQFDLI